METIIAPTDFSLVSLNAVNYAADMAMATNSSLLILHANEPPLGAKTDYDEKEIEEKLIALKENLNVHTGGKIKISSKELNGMIETELPKICSYKDPFAIVMATHGPSLRKLFFIGSITIYLSRNLKYPVIVVPENAVFKPVVKIALATDMKDIYELPVVKISSVVVAFNAELHIVHVNRTNTKFHSESAEVKTLNKYLRHLDPKFHFINDGKNVQNGILSFANEHDIDMILTFPKKHSLFHNSQSKQLIFNSTVTVMTIQ